MTTKQNNDEPVFVTTPSGSTLFGPEDWSRIQNELSLSPRQLQIVQSIFDDDSELDMGNKLSISRHTVHTYVERTFRKLEVQSRVALVVRVFAVHQQVSQQ